jgi:hypothetical protein
MFISFGNIGLGHGSRYLPIHEKNHLDCLLQFFMSACGRILKHLRAWVSPLMRDSADGRQVFVSLTDLARRLREKGLGMNLVKASGLTPEEFPKCRGLSSRELILGKTVNGRRRL